MELAASSAGLLCFVGQALQATAQLHHFFSSVASAPTEIRQLTHTINSLHHVLLDIQQRPSTSKALESAVRDCADVLVDLENVVKKRGRSRFKWVWKEKEVRGLLDRLEGMKVTLTLAVAGVGMEADARQLLEVEKLRGDLDRWQETRTQVDREIQRGLQAVSMVADGRWGEQLAAMIQQTVAETVREALLENARASPPPSFEDVVREDKRALGRSFSEDFLDAPTTPAVHEVSRTVSTNTAIRYRRYRRYATPFGTVLLYFSDESRLTNSPPTSSRTSEAGFTFTPAPWLCRTAIGLVFTRESQRISMSLDHYIIVPSCSPIIELCRLGDVAGVQQLFSTREATPFIRDEHGRSLLHWSAAMGHVELCGLLLSQGADATTTNDLARTALHWTTLRSCNADITRMLLSAGCDASATNVIGQSALFGADEESLLPLLLESEGADVNAADDWGRTALIWTILSERDENLASVTALIAAGASISKTDNQGLTALHMAVLVGKRRVVVELLRNGADPDAKSEEFGIAPADIAKWGGVWHMWVEACAECGIDAEKSSSMEKAVSSAVAVPQGGVGRVKRRRTAEVLPEYRAEGGIAHAISQIPRRVQYGLFEDDSDYLEPPPPYQPIDYGEFSDPPHPTKAFSKPSYPAELAKAPCHNPPQEFTKAPYPAEFSRAPYPTEFAKAPYPNPPQEFIKAPYPAEFSRAPYPTEFVKTPYPNPPREFTKAPYPTGFSRAPHSAEFACGFSACH